MLDIMEALELRNTIFVGHSVSSMIGMLASIRSPQYFERIVMLGPSPRYVNDLPSYYGGFDKSDIDELLDMMQMNFIGWLVTWRPLLCKIPSEGT